MKFQKESQLDHVAKTCSTPVTVYGLYVKKNDAGNPVHSAMVFQDKQFRNPNGLTKVVRRFNAMVQIEPELDLKEGKYFFSKDDMYPALRHFPDVNDVAIEVTESILGDNPDRLMKDVNGNDVKIKIEDKTYSVYKYTEVVDAEIAHDITTRDIRGAVHSGEPIRMNSRSYQEFNSLPDLTVEEALESMNVSKKVGIDEKELY